MLLLLALLSAGNDPSRYQRLTGSDVLPGTPQRLFLLPDQSTLVAFARADELVVWRLSPSGQLEAEKTLVDKGLGADVQSLTLLTDGGLFVAGAGPRAWRFDAALRPLWQRRFPDIPDGATVVHARDTAGGMLLLLRGCADGLCTVELDVDGVPSEATSLGGEIRGTGGPGRVHVTRGGEVLLIGDNGAPPTDARVVKLLPGGRLAWDAQFGTPGDDTLLHLVETAQGFVVLGETLSKQAGADYFVASLDDDGSVVFTRSYGGLQNDMAAGLFVNQSGIVIGGSVRATDTLVLVHLLGLDSHGEKRFERLFSDGRLVGLVPTADGGAFLAAERSGLGPRTNGLYLIKTDAAGDAGSSSQLARPRK